MIRREGLGIKLALVACFLAMLGGARALRPPRGIVSLAPAIDFTGGGWRVKVLTWNVGQAYGKGDSRAQDSQLDAIAAVIRSELPDVIALQELSGVKQLRALRERLTGEYQGFLDEGSDTDRYAAILVRAPKMEFRSIRTSGGRSASAAIFRVARSPLTICAISAHAPAWGAQARRRYAEEIVEWVRAHPYDVVFLGGDFNFEVSAHSGGGALYSDSPAADAAAYGAITEIFHDLGRAGGNTAALGRRIDYVFGRGKEIRVKRVEVLRGRRQAGMDHDPLIVDAVIPNPANGGKKKAGRGARVSAS